MITELNLEVDYGMNEVDDHTNVMNQLVDKTLLGVPESQKRKLRMFTGHVGRSRKHDDSLYDEIALNLR